MPGREVEAKGLLCGACACRLCVGLRIFVSDESLIFICPSFAVYDADENLLI